MPKALTACVTLFALLAFPAWGSEEIDLLRHQIKELEARLDALEKKETAEQKLALQTSATAESDASAAALAPSAGGALESRIKVLEAKQAQEPTATYTPGKGLSITSPDKNFQIRVGGYVQADGRSIMSNTNATSSNQFLIRSARPIIEAKFYDRFSGKMMMDFGNNQTTLLDAYGDYTAAKWFNVRLGKFKAPIGLERWQAEQHVLFVERGLTTNLVPFRDIGMQVYGTPIADIFEYQLAFTNGAPDLANSTGSTDNNKAFTGRVMLHPFYDVGVDALRGLGLGFATSLGSRNGSVANPGLTAGYVTPTQAKFFTYSASAFANGPQRRYNPELMYYNGPFSILSEYVMEDQDIRSGAAVQTLTNQAWMLAATYVLTGEDARFDGVIPRSNFDFAKGDWGAFELVGRVSELFIDPDTFPTFASLSASAKRARESTVGGTWYMNPNVKLNLDFTYTHFDGGATGGSDRPSERAVLSRAQFNF